MRVVQLLLVLAIGIVLTGCGAAVAFAPVVPPTGAAFTATTAPLDVDLDKTDLGSKTGKASSYCVLGLIAWGNAGTDAAARNGNIKTINHADYKSFNLLGVFSSYTTIVYGD